MRRTLLVVLAALALVEGAVVGGAVISHGARQASVVTVELLPGARPVDAGTVLGTGTPGSGQVELNAPRGVSLTPFNQRLLTADTGNNRALFGGALTPDVTPFVE